MCPINNSVLGIWRPLDVSVIRKDKGDDSAILRGLLARPGPFCHGR